MAKNINETGISTGQLVLANHVLQLTDALRGDEAYNLFPSGNIQINNHLYPTGSAIADQGIVSTGGTQLVWGYPNSNTASYVSSANVDGPFGLDSVQSASFALTASHILDSTETFREDFTSQTLVTVNHNFGTENVVVQAYDTTGANPVQLDPSNSTVTITSDDQITVGFGAAQTGYIVVSKGGFIVAGTVQNSISSSYAVTASHVVGISKQRYQVNLDGSSANYTLTHGLGERFVILAAYNPGFEQVIPKKVDLLDDNNLSVVFASAFTGSVVVLS